jgi:hypothetical protein
VDPWEFLAERVSAVLGTPRAGGREGWVRLRVEPRAGGAAVSLTDEYSGEVLEVPLTAAQVREFTGALNNAVRRTR